MGMASLMGPGRSPSSRKRATNSQGVGIPAMTPPGKGKGMVMRSSGPMGMKASAGNKKAGKASAGKALNSQGNKVGGPAAGRAAVRRGMNKIGAGRPQSY